MEDLNCKRASRLLVMLYNEWKVHENIDRPLKIEWNVMHMFSSAQLAKLYALKYGLDPELCSIIAILHDIATVEGKIRENHDQLAWPYVAGAISRYNNEFRRKLEPITDEETEVIQEAISVHSDKEGYSENRYTEMLKNVDCLDRFLYGIHSEGATLDRSNHLLKELGII